MKRDDETYGRIADQYDRWVEDEAQRPERKRVVAPPQPYAPKPQAPDMSRLVFAAIGIGIALLILVLAAISYAAAIHWAGLHRDGASTGYAVVGAFLTIAGVGGLLSTWNHNFRVLTRPPASH
jgi:hypothetical protein